MKLVWTGDGSPSLFHPRYRQTFHSHYGARSQAERVYLGLSGLAALPEAQVVEVGFGLGLNFLVTLERFLLRGANLRYLAFEPDPVHPEILDRYYGLVPTLPQVQDAIRAAWEAPEGFAIAGPGWSLEVRFVPFQPGTLPASWADAVYYDPFSPSANPDAWQKDLLAEARRGLRHGGVLVSYAVAGWVRRALAEVGFSVEKVPGGLGKREWLRAWNISE